MYTGASAPRRRSNEHFDVPAKLLMEVDDQYTRLVNQVFKNLNNNSLLRSQLLSTVLQFQLYKHFCSSPSLRR